MQCDMPKCAKEATHKVVNVKNDETLVCEYHLRRIIDGFEHLKIRYMCKIQPITVTQNELVKNI